MTLVAGLALAVALAALVVAVVALRGVRATRTAAELASPDRPPLDDVDWQLQWTEPGVYVLANTSLGAAALQVEVSSALTPVGDGPATTTAVRAPRVNPGAWVEVRHPTISQVVFDDLDRLRRSRAVAEGLRRRSSPLETTDLAALAAADEEVVELQDRVEFLLSYSVSWRTSGGAPRLKSPLEQRLIPSPTGV